MTKVILIGSNGRMGQAVTTLIDAIKDMKIVAGVDLNTDAKKFPVYQSLGESIEKADVIIDFSHPKNLMSFLPIAKERKLPVVIATTGHGAEELQFIQETAQYIPIFRSANMSVGINLLQLLVQNATKVLGNRYDVEIVEKHHKLKKDAPSGTALMLADSINAVRTDKLRYVCGRSGTDSLRQNDELGIHSVRGGTIVGDHDVYFTGTDEVITISHQAYSRQVFATGAITAARYVSRQRAGLYNMQDVINESNAVTTIYTVPDQALVSIEDFPKDMNALSALYGLFAEGDVFIDMISHTSSNNNHLAISFSINSKDLKKTQDILSKVENRYIDTQFGISENVTKVTVEGAGMEFQSGVAYRVFSCMAKEGIAIKAVSTSEVKISYIVPSEDVSKGLEIIKKEFSI